MSDEKVQALFGGAVITGHRERSPELVEELEMLLEAAQSGEIIELVGGVLYFDGASSIRCVGKITRNLLGTLVIAQDRMVKQLG